MKEEIKNKTKNNDSGTKSNDKNDAFVITVRKDMIFPIIFVLCIICLVVFMMKNAITSTGYKNTAQSVESQANTDMMTYMDNDLNMVMSYPADFQATRMDENIMAALMKVLEADGKDVTLYNTKIPTEIAPVVFMRAEDGSTYSEFMSLAVRGVNVNLDRLSELKPSLMQEFKDLATSTDLSELIELDNTVENGYLVQRLKGKISDDKDVYYTQVGTIIGKNFVTLTHGTSNAETDMIATMKYMLGSVTSLNDKSLGEKTNNEQDLVGTGLIAPRELTTEMKEAVSGVLAEEEEDALVDEAIDKLREEGKVKTEEELNQEENANNGD